MAPLASEKSIAPSAFVEHLMHLVEQLIPSAKTLLMLDVSLFAPDSLEFLIVRFYNRVFINRTAI